MACPKCYFNEEGNRPKAHPRRSDMSRAFVTSAFAGALLLGLTTAAVAVTGEFDNMCTQGLASGKDVKTDCSVNTTLDGKTYCFGNEAAKTEFMKDPKGNLAKAQSYYKSKHPG
jgi:YHS domain-containing protein